MKKLTTLFALALAVFLTASVAGATQPQCTGDRHKDVCGCDTTADCEDGKSCIDGACVTPTECPTPTTSTTLPKQCEGDADCNDGNEFGPLACENGVCVPDAGCPDPAPCQPVTCTNNCDPTLVCNPTLICNVDVCKDGKCSNGSTGTDGAGSCTGAFDCPITVNNTNTTTNVTVNRCPDQEALVPCRRLSNGRLRCPRNKTPRRLLVPYTKAKASQKPTAKNPLP